jgi:hypothetical protein
VARRKTKDERDQELVDARKRAYEEFRPKLAAAQSVADAYKLVVNAPPASSPGRKYYSNLDDFLMSYSPPFGASRDELSLYLALIEKIDKAGELPAGARQKIEEDFRRAME